MAEAAARASTGQLRVTLRAWHACAVYTVIALAATWPLARGLGRDVAWDLGDSLLVMWALAWNCSRMVAIAGGDVGRIATFFDANIFYPEPLTLAYSEHFFAQSVQILPIYVLTGNPILCYNLLFLSTFVLSGLGAFLLVRELTGSAAAGLVAGLLFAFAPYRIPQSSHLQVLSSQWMPFALYGFRRYFDTRRTRALGGASAALVAQNLSCGYYLLYFSPVAAAYVMWEIASRRLWRDGATWRQLAGAAVVVAACTAPFLLPYAIVRDRLQLGRQTGEIVRYSADVYSYATAFSEQPLWGRVAQAFPKPEGQLFPGLVTILLVMIGLWPRRAPSAASSVPRERRFLQGGWLVAGLKAGVVLLLVAIAAALLLRRVVIDTGLFVLQISDIDRLLIQLAIVSGGLLLVSAAARARVSAFLKSRGFFLVAFVAVFWLSLGPTPQALGRPLRLSAPYQLLYDYVPGFEGVRVPARFGMVGTLMLAVLAGFGAQRLLRLRGGPVVLLAGAAVFLAESLTVPFLVNGAAAPEGYNAPAPRLARPSRAPAVYAAMARQPADAVLAELPLGHPDFDLRAMFYSTVHWRRLVNGYSGFFPRHYGQLQLALDDVGRQPDLAWQALHTMGVTHVLVHETAYLGDEGTRATTALLALGAVEVFRDQGDVLLRLP